MYSLRAFRNANVVYFMEKIYHILLGEGCGSIHSVTSIFSHPYFKLSSPTISVLYCRDFFSLSMLLSSQVVLFCMTSLTSYPMILSETCSHPYSG